MGLHLAPAPASAWQRQWVTLKHGWHTARHLRPRQIYYRVRRQLAPPLAVPRRLGTTAFRKVPLAPVLARPERYLGGGRFRFLNREEDLGAAIDWNAPGLPPLWRYNLHYFEGLLQPGMTPERGLALITQWIQAHPYQRDAVGWEPYPTCLRLVNWCKFLNALPSLPRLVLESLAAQGAVLERNLEFHIDGNHLFANGKALWWLGVTLGHARWLQQGYLIVFDELRQQFLADGGHFEFSPMYHAVLLEDLLDLVNLADATGAQAAAARLQPIAGRALAWLMALADAHGRIPLLNDSAPGVAATPAELRGYAARLGIQPEPSGIERRSIGGWRAQNLSGYWTFERGPMRLVFDAAPLGPDYVLGHAHCDMLAVLLEVEGQALFTDTGVYEYTEGERRTYSRCTRAHNTVSIDGLEQAEIWKSFRVGRRGYPVGFVADANQVRCAHSGFASQRAGVQHERALRFAEGGVAIVDAVTGPSRHTFEARFHCAPGTALRQSGAEWILNDRVRVRFSGAEAAVESSPYYPEFGRVQERPCFVLRGQFSRRAEWVTEISASSVEPCAPAT